MRRTGTLIGLLAPLALLAVIYAGVAWVVGSRLPSRASVLGVAVGGLTADEARDRLAPVAAERARQPVRLELDTHAVTRPAEDLGLRIDLDATLARASGFSAAPTEVWRRLNGGGPLTPVTRLDAGVAYAAVAEAARAVDRPLVAGAVTFPGGRVDVVRPESGRRVDVDGTLAALERAWPASSDVTGPVAVTQPPVAAAEVDRIVEQVADRAVSGPLTIVVGRAQVPLAPATFAPALAMRPAGGGLDLVVDPGALGPVLAALPGAKAEPTDAGLRIEGGRPVVVPGRDGYAPDAARTAPAVRAALLDPARTAALHTTARVPHRTTAEVGGWAVTGILGRATVSLADSGGDADAVANAALAARRLDGTLVAPGRTLSLLGVLGLAGAPAADSGWRPARSADDPGTAVVGAGASQTATALSAAALAAGLDVAPRAPHRTWDPTRPEGLDADLRAPDVDLGLRAPADSGLLIEATVAGGAVQVQVWGRPGPPVRLTVSPREGEQTPGDLIGPAQGCVPVERTRPGFTVSVRRIIGAAAGRPSRTDTVGVTYEGRGRVVCPGPPVSPTDPDPALAPPDPSTGY
ncbi:VanW family protein [Agilicoccus flavus]|uniref:VanW family protein n=1 Tax=Agilicoccus flavus TaxID=2775968 RepID=UPI001CF66B7E|nr:VanW family protein [Agilicoccus flavus]